MKTWIELMKEWIQIPSVYDHKTASRQKPFGREVARAIHWIADLAKKDGFTVEETKTYATIDYGEGEPYIGIFCHCDVVPAGNGWQWEPFQLTQHDGKFYGRGVVDDKGPAICAYLAIKALKEEGIVPARKIRLFIGGNEESGFQCIRSYVKDHPQPIYGLVPDAKFPVLHGERGGGRVRFTREVPSLMEAHAGDAVNIIPEALSVSAGCLQVWQKNKLEEAGIRVQMRDDGYGLFGLGGHASKPHQADALIESWFGILEEDWSREVLEAIRYQETWGIRVPKEGKCGSLQITPTVLKVEGQRLQLSCDIRYPETISLEILEEAFVEYRKKNQLQVYAEFTAIKKARYVDPDHFMVRELMELYREAGGDPADPCRLTSAGTYMSELENTVIFGMESAHGGSGNIHGANEFITESQVAFGMDIYRKALLKLLSW